MNCSTRACHHTQSHQEHANMRQRLQHATGKPAAAHRGQPPHQGQALQRSTSSSYPALACWLHSTFRYVICVFAHVRDHTQHHPVNLILVSLLPQQAVLKRSDLLPRQVHNNAAIIPARWRRHPPGEQQRPQHHLRPPCAGSTLQAKSMTAACCRFQT